MRDFSVFGANLSDWQLIPADSDTFEKEAITLCEPDTKKIRADRQIAKREEEIAEMKCRFNKHSFLRQTAPVGFSADG